MKKKIERWLAKKLKMKPEDINLTGITVKFEYLNNNTFEMTEGIRNIDLKEL